MAKFNVDEAIKLEEEKDTDNSLRLKDGTKVPGATSIVSLLDKPYLVNWANKLGLKGIDVKEYKSESKRVGILIHSMLEGYLERKDIDVEDYTDEELDKAEKSFMKYVEWQRDHTIQPIYLEHKLISEEYKFGGIIDCYCLFDGVPTLVDFKTSKSISKEQWLQLSSYKQLLIENNYPLERVIIFDIPKDDGYYFNYGEITLEECDLYFEMFKALLSVYYAKKSLNWEEKKYDRKRTKK